VLETGWTNENVRLCNDLRHKPLVNLFSYIDSKIHPP